MWGSAPWYVIGHPFKSASPPSPQTHFNPNPRPLALIFLEPVVLIPWDGFLFCYPLCTRRVLPVGLWKYLFLLSTPTNGLGGGNAVPLGHLPLPHVDPPQVSEANRAFPMVNPWVGLKMDLDNPLVGVGNPPDTRYFFESPPKQPTLRSPFSRLFLGHCPTRITKKPLQSPPPFRWLMDPQFLRSAFPSPCSPLGGGDPWFLPIYFLSTQLGCFGAEGNTFFFI